MVHQPEASRRDTANTARIPSQMTNIGVLAHVAGDCLHETQASDLSCTGSSTLLNIWAPNSSATQNSSISSGTYQYVLDGGEQPQAVPGVNGMDMDGIPPLAAMGHDDAMRQHEIVSDVPIARSTVFAQQRAQNRNSTDWHRVVKDAHASRKDTYHQVVNPLTNSALGSSATQMETLYTKIFNNHLPFLLYSLGIPQVPRDMLFRGLVPQKRWDESGNVHEILLHDSGLDKRNTDLFQARQDSSKQSTLVFNLD